MNDYERIAKIIRYLDEHHADQPDLDTLAGHLGLSPYHFHRLFTSWAAITPKDFLQCLTLAHARQLLQNGESVLDAALKSGLSGPGRLHDLSVTLESATPGEIKSGGEGWTITYGVAESPFGPCIIGESPRGICHISFIGEKKTAHEIDILRANWPNADLKRNDANASQLSKLIFTRPDHHSTHPPLRALVRGTAFQVQVWQALLRVPPGVLISYSGLAEMLGKPSAARAVGSAIGQNQLAYLIPCHRVIRETGVLGGYRWGLVRKCALMAWETAGVVR